MEAGTPYVVPYRTDVLPWFCRRRGDEPSGRNAREHSLRRALQGVPLQDRAERMRLTVRDDVLYKTAMTPPAGKKKYPGRLSRLPREYYQGDSFVHWTLSIH